MRFDWHSSKLLPAVCFVVVMRPLCKLGVRLEWRLDVLQSDCAHNIAFRAVVMFVAGFVIGVAACATGALVPTCCRCSVEARFNTAWGRSECAWASWLSVALSSGFGQCYLRSRLLAPGTRHKNEAAQKSRGGSSTTIESSASQVIFANSGKYGRHVWNAIRKRADDGVLMAVMGIGELELPKLCAVEHCCVGL
jgi:hypothetical protein